MKLFLTILLFGYVHFIVSQTDTTSYVIKVHFLYGSKPKRNHKNTEYKVFGGLHGGHVSIQVDDTDYGFEPTIHPVHIFPRKKRQSDFVDKSLKGQNRYSKESKTVTFIIPVSQTQYLALKQIHQSYCESTPYDYAFFGMRCASATQDILGQIGILKKKSRLGAIITTFYPKRLRKKLFKLSARTNYQIIRNEGRMTRKWEND